MYEMNRVNTFIHPSPSPDFFSISNFFPLSNYSRFYLLLQHLSCRMIFFSVPITHILLTSIILNGILREMAAK